MAENMESMLKKLEAEKRDLEEKNASLARIIELTHAKPDSMGDSETDGGDATKSLEELKDSMKVIKKTLRDSLQGPAEKHEEMKRLVAEMNSRLIDVSKIPALETKLIEVEKRISGQDRKDVSPFGNIFGGFGAGQTAMMPKNAPSSMKELMKYIGDQGERLETRMLNMEKRLDALREKIGRKNLERLESLVSSKQDISDNLVPRRVKEEVEKILSAFSFEVEGMSAATRDLAERVRLSNDRMDESLRFLKETGERMDKSDKAAAGVQEKSEKWEQSIARLEQTVGDMEKSLSALQTDYRLKNVLRSELSRLSVPAAAPRQRPRRKSRQAMKSEADDKPRQSERKEIERMIENVDEGQAEKINSIKKNIQNAYKSGLISKERYDRIMSKLKRIA